MHTLTQWNPVCNREYLPILTNHEVSAYTYVERSERKINQSRKINDVQYEKSLLAPESVFSAETKNAAFFTRVKQIPLIKCHCNVSCLFLPAAAERQKPVFQPLYRIDFFPSVPYDVQPYDVQESLRKRTERREEEGRTKLVMRPNQTRLELIIE